MASTRLIVRATVLLGVLWTAPSCQRQANGEGLSAPPASARRASAVSAGLTGIWANDGTDKIVDDDLRASRRVDTRNSVWDGSRVKIFGARNEVVAFNVVLEAAGDGAADVSITLDALTGPGGYTIASAPAAPTGVFDWTHRDIELFYVRYLRIAGLSRTAYDIYDERHVPTRLRRPWTGNGAGSGAWTDRADHDKAYPDVAVPIELVPRFAVRPAHSQSIWVDVYIPKDAPAGLYAGPIAISEGSRKSLSIPVELRVRDFALPDTPTAKTILYIECADVARRYTGEALPAAGRAQDAILQVVYQRHHLLAHRHRISLIDQNVSALPSVGDRPVPVWVPILDGSLFTRKHGYSGPGVGVGNGVFSIGTYGSWAWKEDGSDSDANRRAMWTHTDAWERWFEANAPDVERFLYLIDESTNYSQTQRWAQWMRDNPGVGAKLASFATLGFPAAALQVPALTIAASPAQTGITEKWQSAVKLLRTTPGKKLYVYNGMRPYVGSFATDDDGVALRELAWAQYKMGIDRWFYWNATYYNDYQGGRGQTDVFSTAQTFGRAPVSDRITGQSSGGYSNGDGVLLYPGTDRVFPASSYDLSGPIASLRLKTWRRGIQDVDYIAMAAKIDPVATKAIVERMVPKALWEYGVTDPRDPTYVVADISWSTKPDYWEAARGELANIIERGRR